MSLRYFGFRKQPFGSTPDPHFLFSQGLHAEVLARLHRGFTTGVRLQILITPAGLGKTTILSAFSEFVEPVARHIFICNSMLNAGDFLGAIATRLGLRESLPSGVFALRSLVDENLRALHSAGRRIVIIVDEAQDLDSSGIAELGALLQRAPKSVQLVLAGQPELQERLRHPAMAAWRNVKPLTLAPLSPLEVAHYIEHQLLVAGYKGTPIFTPDAFARISELSGGVPRIINQLCSDALMKAFTLGKKVADCQLLDARIDYTELARALDNVVNMDSVLPASAAATTPPTAATTPPTTVAPQPPQHSTPSPPVNSSFVAQPPEAVTNHDSFTKAIHSWLQQRATIWTGTAGELLSGLREIDSPGFVQMTPKELVRKLESALPALLADGIHAELRTNPNGPRMIALRLVPAAVQPQTNGQPSTTEVRRAAG